MTETVKLAPLRLALYAHLQTLRGEELNDYFNLLHEIVDMEAHYKEMDRTMKYEPEVKPKCNQKGCTEDGAYRFTWPGKDEATICEGHINNLRGVSDAMGLHLQVIPLEKEE